MSTLTWTVDATHNVDACDACNEAMRKAITMARCTGSVESTHRDGLHAATVTRGATS